MQKRRWFQIHLPTAIVLMLVASVLLWANIHERRKFNEDNARHAVRYFGWPYDAAWQREIYIPWDIKYADPDPYRLKFFWTNTAADAGSTLGIVVVIIAGCEWVLRRREAVRHTETI